MCKGAAGLPLDFRELEYMQHWIEYPFTNSDNESVVPEIILFSNKVQHSLLFEWKSGANTEPDQLRRYSKISSQDLVEKASLTPQSSSRHDVTIIGKEEFIDRITKGVEQGDYKFPVLSVSNEGLSLHRNTFCCTELNRLFESELKINWNMVPTIFVPFDKDTELWEIAERTIPQILEYMFRRTPRFSLDQLTRDLFPTWTIISPRFQKELRNSIRNVLNQASRNEFRHHLKWNRQIQVWEISKNPLDLRADKRHAAWKKMQNLQKQFITALRTGKRPAVQEELFS
jgi:hypothetical protein